MEIQLKQILSDIRISSLVANKIYLLHAPEGALPPYVEYQILDDEEVLFSEGNVVGEATEYAIQIDIFSKGNYSNIRDAIKEVMAENEFHRGIGGSLFEQDTKLYHYILRYTKGED